MKNVNFNFLSIYFFSFSHWFTLILSRSLPRYGNVADSFLIILILNILKINITLSHNDFFVPCFFFFVAAAVFQINCMMAVLGPP